ncbi:MAG: hypothetical protein PHW56_04800 [Methanosarcinaceae archaeon]|nr:hypothetical protein [Methanosarcinaceae archaeon]
MGGISTSGFGSGLTERITLPGEDESAVCGLQVRFSASVILFTVILLLSAVSVTGILEELKVNSFTAEVLGVVEAAEQLSLRGEGSSVTFELEVPGSMGVGFGALPGKEADWPEAADNYYITAGGKSRFFATNSLFSNSELKGPAVFGPGKYRLRLSSEKDADSGKLFILISEAGGL